jgi:hypothetical protein
MSQNMPGPWRAVDCRHQKNGQIRIWGAGGRIANVLASNENAQTNARLITTAPDGYALAKRVIEYLTPYEPDPRLDGDAELWQMANALVAKAEGRR